MVTALLIALMITIYTSQSLFCKRYTDSYPGKPALASPSFTVVSSLFVVLVMFCFAGFRFSASWETLLLGSLNAIVLFFYNILIVSSSRLGPYSIMMVINLSGGIILPAIITPFLGDKLSVPKLLAIGAVILAVWMISYRKGEAKAKSKYFFPLCLALGVTNGAYCIFLDLQDRITGVAEKEEMVAITFGLAAIASFVLILIREKGSLSCIVRQSKASVVNLAIASASIAFAIKLLVLLLPRVNTAVLFTLNNAGVFLLSVICSALLFRDKLTRLNIIGCALMCAALAAVALVK